MDDYCTCAVQRIDQALFDRDLVHCSNCRKVICCEVAVLDDTVQHHAANMADAERFLCWRHYCSVADHVANLDILAYFARRVAR